MSDTWNHEADAWDSLLFHEYDEYPTAVQGQAFRKCCKHCGQPELTWQKKEGKWRLYNRKWEMHSCLNR